MSRTRHFVKRSFMNKGFTFAEILITIGVIGTISAITLPNIISNNKCQENIAKLKKNYSIFSQAIELSKAEHGDIENWNWDLNVTEFTETYIIKNIQITKNCKTSQGCWNSSGVITGLNNIYVENIKYNNYYKFQLSDGTYTAVRHDSDHIHFYIDTNGNKKPDKYGHDCFVFTLTKGKLSDGFHNTAKSGMYMYGHGLPRIDLINNYHGCNKKHSGANCGALFQYDGWKLQPDYQL